MKKLLMLLISIALLGGTAFGASKKIGIRDGSGQFVAGQGYIPRDANIVGFVNLKSLLKNAFIKTFAEHAKLDQYLAMAQLKRSDLKTVVVFAKILNPLQTTNPKAAVILQSLDLFKTELGKKIQKSPKITYKKTVVYANKNGKEFATVHQGNALIGTEKGVKGAIDAKNGRGGINNRLKSVLGKLHKPMGAMAFGVSKEILAMITPHLNNPQIAAQMPALKGFVTKSEAIAFGGYLKGKSAFVEIVVKSGVSESKAIATAMTMMKIQMKQMLPMMKQKLIQQAGEKSANLVMATYKSLQFTANGRYLKISFSFDFSQITPDDLRKIAKKLR